MSAAPARTVADDRHHEGYRMPPFNFGHVVSLLLIPIVVLSALGTAGPQYKDRIDDTAAVNPGCKDQVYLYQRRLSDCTPDDFERVRKYHKGDFACEKTYSKLTAAYAFGIIASSLGFIALLLSLLTAFVPRIPSWIAVPFIVMTMISLLISWAISESVRRVRQCDEPNSYRDAGYKIDWGLALLITAWCLSVLTTLLAIIFGCLRACTRPVVVVKNEHEARRASDANNAAAAHA